MDLFRRQDSRFMDPYVTRNVFYFVILLLDTFFRNGDHSRFVEIILKPSTTFQHLRDEILHKLGLKDTGSFHLFTSEGIELYDDYIPLIRAEDRLYASLGEKFDQSASLAEYKEIALLGQGGFGKVLLMEHQPTSKKYAVKYVDARKYGLANLIDMVFKEAELLKSLNHKNIVEIISFFALNDLRVVFVMEYLEGGELGEYLKKKGRLEEDEAREIFRQLADAVYFCHTNNIIHRDLKLENILFESKDSNIIKVVDFGIAGFYTNIKGSESSAGSLRYMAPEVLTGRNRAANPAIDVWSMGVILFALLTGSLPFKGNTRKEILEKIICAKYEFPPEIKKKLSFECLDLLSKILVVDYKSRITSFDLTNHPWVKGEKIVSIWFDEDKLQERGSNEDEEEKNLKNAKNKSARVLNFVPSKPKLSLYSRNSIIEKDALPKIPMSTTHQGKSSTSQELLGFREHPALREKKSLMYEESKKREKRLATLGEISVKDFIVSSPGQKSFTPKKLMFPPISQLVQTQSAGKSVARLSKKEL